MWTPFSPEFQLNYIIDTFIHSHTRTHHCSYDLKYFLISVLLQIEPKPEVNWSGHMCLVGAIVEVAKTTITTMALLFACKTDDSDRHELTNVNWIDILEEKKNKIEQLWRVQVCLL